MKKIKPYIHKEKHPKFRVNSDSNCHYGFHCGGFSYAHCESIAQDMASGMLKANQIPNATHYKVIDIAIIQYLDTKNFYIEDRSIRG